jgi:diacylglycerol kinase
MEKRKFHQSAWLALKGIASGISKERNIKIQMVIGIAVIVVSLLLKISTTELAIIISISFLVIVLEMLNTGLEKLFDILRPDYDRDIGKVKDMIAGAVLMSAILSIILGFLILLGPIIDFFKTSF